MPIPETIAGRTIHAVKYTPFCSGFDGATESIKIQFDDGGEMHIRAGSYCIPEESCMYIEFTDPPGI